MSELAWKRVRGVFVFDGAWLGIYIFSTDLSDWQRALDKLRLGGYELGYYRDGEPANTPVDASQGFTDRESVNPLLSVRFAGILANSHFFSTDEIEFDIDPREITNQAQLDALIDFMHTLAEAVGKEVVLTPEGCRETALIRVRPGMPALNALSAT